MDTKTIKKLSILREKMKQKKVDAFIIPSSDPHMSEYLPLHWKVREWMSGFNGSAGTLVVTLHEAGLWTDSRYYLQASEQLKDTSIKLFKDGLQSTPSISEFLSSKLPQGAIISFDGEMVSVATYSAWQQQLPMYQLKSLDIIHDIWLDRPPLPTTPCFIYEEKYAGKSCQIKLKEIREQHLKADQALLITALDEIAWILNIRGDEIPNNPVVISYLLLTTEQCFLFIDPNKLGREVKDYFKEQGVLCQGYKDIYTLTKKFAAKQLLYDPETTNIKLAQAIAEQVQTKTQSSPIALMKALRNPVEIKNVKQAMIKDGVAMVQFLIWLDQNKDKGITELDVSDKLYQLRSKQDLFQGESFDTIAGYGKHGAIVHYSATPASNATLKPEGFILVDSGAQYLDGTTDLTRTIALGELSEEEKLDYTLVLKGHIALARAKFPEGTRGSQLDILARLPLWEQKKNFLHGTGHGVGQFLCVHEGPQSIRMNENPITLQIGMLTSNEPGVYIDGSHGVRIENLMLVAPWSEGLFGNYYQFETVTLCPICTRGIIKSKLTAEEIDWLNNYHQQVYHKLSPHLTAEEQKWLAKATSKI